MAKLLGLRSCTACAGQMGKHKHRVFPSLQQSLLVATGSLEENVLPLLRYWLSPRVKKVLMLCRYWAATTDFLFVGINISIESAGNCCQRKTQLLLRSILWSFIGLWVKIWHRNKTAYSKSNPVQSSRSKSTSCVRKGCQLKFQPSDFRWRSAKSWKWCQAWFWIDCNQSLQPNRSQMKCDVWKPCSDQRWQIELRFSILRLFELSDLVNNHLLC